MTIAADIMPDTENRVSLAVPDRAAALARASEIFRRDGVVVVDDLVDPQLIERCRTEIVARDPALATVDHARNFGKRDGRHTTPVLVTGALADRAIFLPEPLTPFFTQHLSKNYELDSLGVLVALAGAGDQNRHTDGILFIDVRLDGLLPPVAIALAMPLVPMDEVNGRTEFWRGSHRQGAAEGAADFAPVVQPGSAILWDFRIHHRGLANHSDRPRPVLYAVFCRNWWAEPISLDSPRYQKLLVADAVVAPMERRERKILRRATIVPDSAATLTIDQNISRISAAARI